MAMKPGSGGKGEDVIIPSVASRAGCTTGRAWYLTLLASLALGAAIPSPVSAQIPGPALNAVARPPPGSPIERLGPRQLPGVSPGGLNLSPIDEGNVPNIPVAVRRAELVGATLFNAELQPELNSVVGPATSLVQLNNVRLDILRYYRSRGYALTSVALSIDRTNGVVRYTVTEGHIAAVKLDGDIGPAGAMVLKFLNRLTEYPAIDTATLERYLLLAQDVPGVSISTVLEPSKDEPGALILVAQVGLKRFSGQVALDNRAYVLTGPIEGLGVLDVNGLTSWGDKTEFSFFHSFPNSQNFGQVSEEWFIGASGLKMKIYFGLGNDLPTGSLAALGYSGFTTIFGGQLSYPVIRSRQQNLNVYGSFDALDSTVDTTSSGVTSRASTDNIRALRIGEDYIISDLLLGNTRPATNQVSTRISQGLEFLGGYHGPSVIPETARLGEQHNFIAIKFELNRTQTLFVPWEGASVAVMGLFTGQWTPNVLPPAEQFYLGGSRFTRGYYSGQVPGDKALAATGELQLNTTIDLSWLGSRADVASQFYAFYDWGEVWSNNRSFEVNTIPLRSTGLGVRMQITNYVEVDLEGVYRDTLRPPPLTSDLSRAAFYWRVVGRF
jgi:hemolysin activation/secretion protein